MKKIKEMQGIYYGATEEDTLQLSFFFIFFSHTLLYYYVIVCSELAITAAQTLAGIQHVTLRSE